MNDREITLQLAVAMRVEVSASSLDPLFDLGPELTEWSINSAHDRRGTLRVSTWTRDRAQAARALERLAPAQNALRAQLVGDDYEGIGLALRIDAPPSVRWWALANDGAQMAARVREVWPQHASALDELLGATGGPQTCTAVGIEEAGDRWRGDDRRQTIYTRLGNPAAALRLLEVARTPVTRAANLFWKGICGLEPGGRPWPKVWAGRSMGTDGGWKFYYFARGDELRRSDEVLLDAVGASPELFAAWRLLAAETGGPCVQLVGLTIRDGQPPAFSLYLAKL